MNVYSRAGRFRPIKNSCKKVTDKIKLKDDLMDSQPTAVQYGLE